MPGNPKLWCWPKSHLSIMNAKLRIYSCGMWVRSPNCVCLVTWFCYQLIAKPDNKSAAVSWPNPYNLSFICSSLLCELILGEPPNWLNPIIRTPSKAHWSMWCWFTSFCEYSLSHKICTWSVADTWNKLLTLVDYMWNCYLHFIELLLIHINQNLLKHCSLIIDLYKSNICLDFGESCA